MNRNDYLAHYGILGMRWGIRRFQPYSVRGRKSGEGGKEIGLAKKRSNTPTHEQLLNSTNAKEVWDNRDQLSDKELRDRVNRIQTEQQLQQMISQSTKKGETAATKYLKKIETMAVTALAAATFKGVTKAIKDPEGTIEKIGKASEMAKYLVSPDGVQDFIAVAEWMLTPWNP